MTDWFDWVKQNLNPSRLSLKVWAVLGLLVAVFVFRPSFSPQLKSLDGRRLVVASAGGRLSEVKRLLAAGADPRYKMQDEGEFKGDFPLFLASEKIYTDIMEALLEAGADVNQVEAEYSTSSLYHAAARNHPRAIALLVRNGGDVNLADSVGSTPLLIAAQYGHKG